MIDADKRMAIFRLHQEGMTLCEISRSLHVSRHTVRSIVRQQGKVEPKLREDRISVDTELLTRLYRECRGWIYRIHGRSVALTLAVRQLQQVGCQQTVEGVKRRRRIPFRSRGDEIQSRQHTGPVTEYSECSSYTSCSLDRLPSSGITRLRVA